MSNILLTGATGFIGSNILKKIRLDNNVFIIQRAVSKKKIKKTKNIKIITFEDYNTLSRKLKKIKVDIVIHCATHYKKEHFQKDINKFIQSNILLGNIILENIKELNAKKFINEFGNPYSQIIIDSDGTLSVEFGTLAMTGATGNDLGANFTTALTITTNANTNTAMGYVDTAIDAINTRRATLGAAISRLEHTVDNLENNAVNHAASRSRILDADYAAETTELARTQIIQQAGTAMLSQANQKAQAVLKLLQS